MAHGPEFAGIASGRRGSRMYDLPGLTLPSERAYVRRLLIALLFIGLAYFLWRISSVLLLVFAAVLISVLLSSFAELIARYTPIPPSWSLAVALLAVATLASGFLAVFGAQISGQVTELVNNLPYAIDTAGERIGVPLAAERLEEKIANGLGSKVLSHAAGIGFAVVGALLDLALVFVASLYLAADPRLYRRGAIKLLPPAVHERALDAMEATAAALRLWFAGQLVTMTLVGTISGVAYWWIGLPSPLGLGLIAGATNFVPFIGPFLGAIPALILALAADLKIVLWTVGAIFLIQQLEGNLITPLVQRRAVSLPPALGLFAIVIFGMIFGLVGVFLAVPLTVALLVLVKKLWIRQTLGEDTPVPGEGSGD